MILLALRVQLGAVAAERLAAGAVLTVMGRDFASRPALGVVVAMGFLDGVPGSGLGHVALPFELTSDCG